MKSTPVFIVLNGRGELAFGIKEQQSTKGILSDRFGWLGRKRKAYSSSKAALDVSEVSGINSRLELAEACRLLNDRTIKNLALDAGVTVVDPLSTWIAPEVTIGNDSTILPGCYLEGAVEIGANCVIGSHTVIKGPARIGARSTILLSYIVNSTVGSECRVGPFAHLRDGAQAADNVRIGNYVEIKRVRLAAHTNVSHLSYVGDSSLGCQVNIGAGTITANYDHISKAKCRTIIADGASTGSNSVLVAPITIGKNATVAAGTVATRDVPEGALAVGRARQEVKEGWMDSKKAKLSRQVDSKTVKS